MSRNKISLIVSLVCTAISLNSVNAGQDFEEMLSQTRIGDAEEIWHRILSSDYRCSSQSSDRNMFFEFSHRTEGPNNSKFRCFLEDDGARQVKVMTIGKAVIDSVVINDKHFLIDRDLPRWIQRKHKGWSFRAEDPYISFDGYRHPDGYDRAGFISFAPGTLLAEWIGRNPSEIRWHDATRTLTASASDGRNSIVRFRTPNDQLLLGTSLAELYLDSPEGGYIFFRSLVVGVPSALRSAGSLEDAVDELEAVAVDGASPNGRNPCDTSEAKAEAWRLERRLLLACSEDTRNHVAGFPSAVQQNLCGAILHGSDCFVAGQEIPRLDSYLDTLSFELDVAYRVITSAISDGGTLATTFVDDANAISLGLDRTVGGRYCGMLAEIFRRLLASKNVRVDQKLRLCMMLGEFGPIYQTVPDSLNDNAWGGHGRLLQAILYSRWNWEPTSEMIDVCHEAIRNPFPHPFERHAATGALVAWGHVEEIPESTLDSWVAANENGMWIERHNCWKRLTQFRAGRRYLLSRLDSVQFADEAIAILSMRARNTVRLKRYEFMSEEECRAALDAAERVKSLGKTLPDGDTPSADVNGQ